MKFYELERGTAFYLGTNRARIYVKFPTFTDDDGVERNAAQVSPEPTRYVTIDRDENVTPVTDVRP